MKTPREISIVLGEAKDTEAAKDTTTTSTRLNILLDLPAGILETGNKFDQDYDRKPGAL